MSVPVTSPDSNGPRPDAPRLNALCANVELKAKIPRLADAVAIAQRLGAVDAGEDEQTDTYFSLGTERLKLRESSSGVHLLIRYSRPDRVAPRKSQYRLMLVKDAASFKSMLTRQWGVKAVVRKRRRTFVWEGRVRIHLDVVHGLGEFIEFTAMLDPTRPDYDESAAALDVARLAHDFAVRHEDLVATSYATLVLASPGIPSGT